METTHAVVSGSRELGVKTHHEPFEEQRSDRAEQCGPAATERRPAGRSATN